MFAAIVETANRAYESERQLSRAPRSFLAAPQLQPTKSSQPYIIPFTLLFLNPTLPLYVSSLESAVARIPNQTCTSIGTANRQHTPPETMSTADFLNQDFGEESEEDFNPEPERDSDDERDAKPRTNVNSGDEKPSKRSRSVTANEDAEEEGEDDEEVGEEQDEEDDEEDEDEDDEDDDVEVS
jgi:hypothetical protein